MRHIVRGVLVGQHVPQGTSRVVVVGKQAKVKPEREPKVDNPRVLAALEAAHAARLSPQRPTFSAKRSKEVEEKFLDGLRQSWSVSKSAWNAGIAETTAYAWKRASLDSLREDGTYKDDFCVRWIEAHQVGIDSLEDEAIRRAKHGVDKPIYQGGVLVGAVTEYSDTLMTFVLRGKAPKTYNTERHEHTGADGAPIEHNMSVTFIKSGQKK